MTVSKSVGRGSNPLATEIINFYVNIKSLAEMLERGTKYYNRTCMQSDD